MNTTLQEPQASSQSGAWLNTARRRASVAGRTVGHFIKSKPTWALGLSLGMGVIAGWLVKRR